MTASPPARLTGDKQASLTAGAAMWTTVAIPSAGIAALRMADGPMGVAGSRIDERDVSILTPAPIALGASWDTRIVRKVGALVGGDARDRDVHLVLAPNINLARSPLAGRAFEYFSEDPLLAGMLGASWIEGLQSRGVGAVAKHLVCNDSETARDTVDVEVDERTLREVYLLPFELAAQAGCAGMLTGYNRVNGTPCSQAGDIIVRIVKDEWGFDGVVMSDWFGTQSTVGCLNGGLDLEMPGPPRFLGVNAIPAIMDGAVTSERVGDAARRVGLTARRFVGAPDRGEAQDRIAVLREAAAAGFTLVRNEDGLLPVAPGSVRRIAVIGPNADAPCFQGGTFAKIALRPDAETPLASIRARFGQHCDVVHARGAAPHARLPRMPATPARDIGDGCTSGLTIDYFDSLAVGAEPVFSETRDTNTLTWFAGLHAVGAFPHPARTRASCLFMPTVSGRHAVFIGGTGPIALSVGGEPIFRHDEPIAAADVMGRLKGGDSHCIEIDLQQGVPVELAFELAYQPARAQGLWYGIRGPEGVDRELEAAVELARSADVVFLIVGESSDASVESKDRETTNLPAEQIALIEAITAANPRTAIIANVGHAFDTRWENRAAALLIAWYPGEEFGPALAEVLAGDREPGGRMPVSIAAEDAHYPALLLVPDDQGKLAYKEQTRIGYRGLAARNAIARHAFGSGFGYARFTIDDARLERADEEALHVSVTCRNVSNRAGAEVIQIYREAPELTLVAFAKVALGPAEECRVIISVQRRMLQTWDQGWRPVDDCIALKFGRASDDLKLTLQIRD